MNYRTLRVLWKYAREVRSLFRLSLPIMAGLVGQTLMGIADTVMVGQVGVIPLAASSLVINLFHLPMVFGFGMLTSVSVLSANAFGAKDPLQVGRVYRASAVLTLVTSALLVVIFMAFRWILPFLGQPPEVVDAAGGYLWFLAPSLLPMLLGLAGKQFCEALNHPWIPTLLMIGGVLLNILLNWMLIYGNLGCPAMGLNGAGLATLLARIVTAAAMIAWLVRSKSLARFRQGSWSGAGDLPVLRKLFKLGLPVSLQHLLEMGSFAFAALMLGWIGANALAAHQIAFTCASTTFMFSLSLGMAASVRVGQVLGAGLNRRVRRIGLVSLMTAVVLMTAFGCLFFFGGRTMAAWFVESKEVQDLAVQLLMVAAIFQVFDGLQVTAISILRGMQDVRIPAIVAIVAYWLLAMPMACMLAFYYQKGALGIWIGLALGLGVAAFCLTFRFYFKTKVR